MGKRVVLAMSGGVDSSVAAALLKEQGYDVLGLFMRTGAHAVDEERRAKTCCSVADAMDARNVADRLDIPFYVLDFERDFARIEDYFADEYLAGRTPNPCVMCNIWLKFGKLWSYGKQVGADFVATGHYARIARADDGTLAGRARRGPVEGPVVRPLRAEARAAAARPLPGGRSSPSPRSASWPASSACRSTTSPTARRSASSPTTTTWVSSAAGGPSARRRGRSWTSRGTSLGEHSGIEAFTIGQRRGLGIAFGEPRYVVQIEPLSADRDGRPPRVARQVGPARLALQLARPRARRAVVPCLAQIRAQHRAVPATVEPIDDRRGTGRLRHSPVRGHSRPGRHRLSGRSGPWGGMDRPSG